MIACLRDALMEWISHIEIDQDKYSVEMLPMECHHPMYGRLAVNYDTKLLFFVDFYKKYGRTNEGKRTVNGMFHIRIQDEGKDLLTPGDSMILQINDRFQVNYRGRQNVPIAQALMDVLPIRDEEKVGKIVEILGITPRTYILNVRLEKARYLIEKNPELSIFEVSIKCGYEETSNFIHAFKKHFGISPNAYKKNIVEGKTEDS